MSALAEQQRALLRALWAPRHQDAIAALGPHLARADAQALRGLRAYRSHGRALAERALGAAFPTVREVLGDADFGGLARAHWLRHPPAGGDVAEWGGALADHIAAIPQLVDDEPRLADIARLDWALHRAASAADAEARPATLQLLVEEDPARIALQLAPGTACVAGELVWRQGLAPRRRALAEGEAGFLEALLAHRSLAAALDAAPTFEFQPWLQAAVRDGLLLGAHRIP